MSTSPRPDGGPAPTASILRRAFAILRDDVPEAYRKLVAAAPPVLGLVLGGPQPGALGEEELCIVRASGGAEVEVLVGGDGPVALGAPAAVRVRTAATTVLALCDGKVTLLDAVLDGALVAVGDAAALAAAHDALRAFVQGAVRSPRMPPLLHEFRDHATSSMVRPPPGQEAA